LLSSSDVFNRSTETIPDLVEFSAGAGGDSFGRSFQTFGCLVLRYGRLFVKSLNREDQGGAVALLMSEQRGAGTIFPAKRTSNGLSDLAGLHIVAGKMSQSPGSGAAQGDGIPLAIDDH
jgi:hypothetical protein